MSKELTENVANNVANTNSQHLTKKYYKGDLPSGYYYFSNGYEVYPVRHCCVKGIRPFADNNVSVICKMPTYDQFVELTEKVDQFSQLVKKVHKLDEENRNLKNVIGNFYKRLKEAEEVIRLYFKSTQNAVYKSLGMHDGYYKRAFIYATAKEYLEKYGVENEQRTTRKNDASIS